MIRPLQEEVRSYLRSGVAITNLTQCVEELVLNSLDAGASCITVRIDIPNFKIQVSDNGNGIAFGDLKSVGERYSSSKCHVLEDLEQLSFYGFRGEALASIRELCDVLEIVTRHRSSYHTYCKLFRNSQVLELTESRFPRASTGTSVTIHGIFANLPVRRKAITETLDFERVRHRIASIALIHPETAFILLNDSTGTKCLQTHVCKSIVSTFSRLFGNQRSKNLQPVKFEHNNFKVSGFISTDTHHSKNLQFLFVNGRLLLKTRIHKLVNHILGKSELLRMLPVVEVKDSTRSEGYQRKTSPKHGKIVDKHGIFVLNIDCLVTEYDICLEPAKTLIEFQDWEKVLYCVERCVEEFLMKHNLFSNVEDSENTTESEANDDHGHTENSYTNLEAFEYKREIETNNVKKSLHSSTVFRPKKVETRDCGSQDKTSSCLVKGCSNSLLSDGRPKHTCESDRPGNGLVISKDFTASDSNPLSEAAISRPTNVDKHQSSSTCKDAKDLNRSTEQVTFNDRTTCHVTYAEGRTTIGEANGVKEAQNEVNDTFATTDLVSTLSAHSHCGLSDSEKVPTGYSGVSGAGHSNEPQTLFNEHSDKNGSNRVFASYTFPRTTCSTTASIDKAQGLTERRNGSGCVHASQQERFNIPLSISNHNPQSSTSLPRQTGTSSAESSKERTVAKPAFTSPCPITLKGQCTRKRPPGNKETSVTELALPSKNRRLITLQGSSQSRVRHARKNAGQFSDVKGGEYSNCDTTSRCIAQEKSADNCNAKSSATSIITQTSANNVLDTAMYNSDVNCCDSSSGVTVPSKDTCDSGHSFASFDPTQLISCDSTNQICSSRFGIESQQYEEHSGLNSVISRLNVTEKERIMHKFTEYLDCSEKESEEKKGNVLEPEEGHCSMTAELNSEPKLSSVDIDKNGTCRKFSSDNDWYCTFDVSLGRKLFINTRTGHSSFETPCRFNVKDNDCSEQVATEANEIGKDCFQHLPHPCASHLSFSCTPWLPRENRRQQTSSVYDNGNGILCPEGMSKSQLADLYKEHLEQKETEEKLCKWRDADTLQAYEQDLLNNRGKTVAQLLDSWHNPVFTAPEKDILMINKPSGDKSQISVHNVVHPYCFTKGMLAGMRVLRQLDDKFIVGVFSQEGEDDGLLVLVDQHAAHERVRLERLQSELFEDGDVRQTKDKPCIKSSSVSPPLELSLFPEEVRLLKTFQTEIEQIGIRFVINESSQVSQETVVLVHGVPSVFVEREVSEVKRGRPSVAVSNVKALIREHLEHISSTCGVATVIPKVISQVISSQACHGAVKFGEPLGLSECQELIKCLSKCQLPFQCAHGRPSVIPLVDLKFLGKKMNSEEIVQQPRIAKLQLANQFLKNTLTQ